MVEDESAIAELIAVNLRHNGFRPIWAMDRWPVRSVKSRMPCRISSCWMDAAWRKGLRYWQALACRWRTQGVLHHHADRAAVTSQTGGRPRCRGADDYIAKAVFHEGTAGAHSRGKSGVTHIRPGRGGVESGELLLIRRRTESP